LKARYRVKRIENDKIFLDRPARDEDFPDVDGDGRRMVQIYDHAEGDEVTMYSSVFVRVEGAGARMVGEGKARGF